MSNNIEDIKKNQYKENIINKQQVINDTLKLVEQYKEQLYKESNIDKKNIIKIEIKKLNRKIGHLRCSITNSKKTIRKIIGNKVHSIDHNVLLLLINYIDNDNSLFNLLITDKLFNNIIKNEYNCFILLCKYNTKHILIKIPKYIITEYKIELEQIFYVPLTSEGRTIIHLCARTNNKELLVLLYHKFPNLNINCLTTSEQWHPAHNALNHKYYRIFNLLLDIGIDDNYIINNKDRYRSIKEYIDRLYTSNHDRINTQRDLDNSIEQSKLKLLTKFNYNMLLEDKFIINELKQLYKFIYDYKPFLFKIIGNINL